MMPKVDGLALLHAVRGDEKLRDTPVILLSARAGEESRVEGLKSGADDYLVKPFSARELQARVGSLLELTRMRRENEQRFHAFVSATFEVIYRMNADWSEMHQLQGRNFIPDTQDPSSTWLDEYIPADDQPPLMAKIREAIRTGGVFQLEHRVRRVDGSVGWVLSRAVPLKDAQGNVLEWFGAASDITERKHAEERLREREEALRHAHAELQKSEARLRDENRVQELLRKVSQSLVAAQLDLERVVQIATDAATELSGAAFGAFFYNVRDERGEALTLYTLAGAPREAFARFPQPRNTGVFGPTFRGESIVRSDDITADPRYGHNAPYHGMPEGHLPVRSYLAVPVKAATGEVLGGLFFGHPSPGVFNERAERLVLAVAAQAAVAFENARLHRATRLAEEALSETDRRKDEFLAMLAHELRNPLAPIGNASEALARMLSGDARVQSVVGMIKRQATQLTRLVDDLLDVSRITQGRIQLSRQPIELSTVIAQAVETVEPLLREKQHGLSVTSSSYEHLYVDGDFARLLQCVGNILTNAAKYTEPGGEIRVQTRAEDDTAVIEISDDGAGIPPQLLPHVFDLFVQSDRTLDRAQGGLGVGLAVVKRLVQMHGGEATARSAGEGRGSSFEIRLPRIPRPVYPSESNDTPHAARRRVLIVDDNDDAGTSLALLLGLQGHDTAVTGGAKEALSRIEAFRPDVALLDLGLPGMDGYELARAIRALPGFSTLRLIAVSGYGQAEDRRRTREAGFDDHLVKPVDLAMLERALATA